MKPFITVVMPVRNEVRFIGETLGQLVAQDYPEDRFEIIVADGMSDDGTRELVAALAVSHRQIRLLDNPKQLSSAGRNAGFRNGTGEFFMVVDGHCYIPTDQLFNNLVHCFDISGADCLGRPQPLDPPGLTLFQQAVALARQSRLGHGGDSLIYSDYEGYCSPVSNGAAYRREVFEKVGYVDENFDAAEDVEFNYRIEKAGLKCYTSPRLKVCYYPRASLGGLYRQMKRYGKGRCRFMRKHKEALSVNQMLPGAFAGGLLIVLGLGVLTLLSGSWFTVFPLLLLPYLLYASLVIAQSLQIALRHGMRYFSLLPMIFVAVHCALGFGLLTELVSVRQYRVSKCLASLHI